MNNSGIGTPYWYEWEIGIIECLKMMMDNEISTVVLQSSEFQKLDDVVVNYKDGSMANIQVKHTDIDANLTYSFLDSENDSILGGLAKEWKEKKQKYQIREIQLVTNKKWGPAKSDGKCSMRQFVTKVYPKLKEDVSYCGENELEEAAITWFKTALKLSEDDMKAFIKVFSFREELDLEKIEQTIKQKIEQILGTKREDAVDSCLSKVLAELRIWSTSRRKKQEITKEDIYKVVCIKDTGIPVYDLYPEKPIFPSRERFAKEFISKIEKTTNKIVFLQGLPGAGKTNFISYLSQLNQSIVDFRYYTYLPVGRDQTSYSDDEGFYLGSLLWKSILVQLRTKFEKMGVLSNVEFPVAYQYLSVSEMRKYAIKFLPIYARKISRTCYIFIDGIDHAARSLNARNSFLLQLPKPEEVGNGIKIILVGQPVNDKYPSWLLKNENIDYIFMPSLETDDIIMLLDNNIRTLKVDNVSLANTIISVVGNNALNVLFAIMELKKIDGLLSFEDIERILGERCLNSQIDKYYEWIINSIERSMLFYKIQAIFACVSRKILLEDISRICDCQEDDVLLILNNLYPLLLCDGDGYYVFHNDVRLHLKNEIIVNSNYAYIVEKIKRSINCNWKLEKYKYDILYDLVLNLKDTEEILNLVTVDYIMQSVMYDISFETLSKQFLNIMNLLMYKGQYKYLPEVSTIALTLSQFAKCILYYDKKKIYVENTMTKSKTRSEKYILGFENNTEQIINDIYYLYVNDLPERAKKVFYEYIGENNFSYIYNFISKDKKLCNKMGYIYRFNDIALPKENEITKNYADFVDGWLEASINYVMEEDIKKTFSFRKYYPQSLRKFSENIFKRKDITIDVYLTLKRILLAEKMPISAVIELCIYGITNKYPVKDVISYIKKNLEQLKQDCTYEFEQDRLLGIIKAWFCIYIVVEYTDIENLYNELLIKAHIEEKARGYGPAIAQMTMAKNVFEIFYNQDDKYKLTQDTIFGFMYFSDRYGIGSCYDCNAYKIISFLRTVFVNYARNNQKSESIKMVCSSIIQCLSWEKTRYVAEFNELFLIADLKKDFLQLVEYWCGIKGKAWNNEYSDIEYYCSSIIQTLKLFNENEKADIIQEREKMRLLGYVGNKEYSLIDLLQYYIQIPISEKKLLTDGMLLLKISDSVSDIGDNRTCFEIDQELFKVANKLGYQFLNALFEMKNRPVDFIHWRRTLLTVLFDDIKKVDSDEELLYLYSLTNAWINARFESQRPYGQLETLKQYNNKIINKISNEKLCLKLKENGNYEIELEDRKLTVKDTNNFYGIFCILEDNGYSEVFENAVMAQIEMGSGASKLLLEVREKIHGDNLIQFTNRCVKRYILKEEKYGFLYSAVREVLKTYYQYFNEESWKCILKSIVERLSWINIDSISEIGTDIEIFTLYYLLKFEPEKIEDTFLKLCSAHMKIITANGRISSTKYELAIDNDINSIYEMARYQLGEQNLLI